MGGGGSLTAMFGDTITTPRQGDVQGSVVPKGAYNKTVVCNPSPCGFGDGVLWECLRSMS